MKQRKPNRAVRIAANAVLDRDGQPTPLLQSALHRAVESQRPLARANIRRMRRKAPQATPVELALKLERDFLGTVTGSGAAIGATAVVPGIGTIAALGISAAATVMFMEATAIYALSVAELHGVNLDNPEQARTAVMAIMLGEEGNALMQSLTGQAIGRGTITAPLETWGPVLAKNVPANGMKFISSRIQKVFIKKVIAHQGASMLGRLVPFGVGAVIGGASNHLMGRAVIKATKLAFGVPPLYFPLSLTQADSLEQAGNESSFLITAAETATSKKTTAIRGQVSQAGTSIKNLVRKGRTALPLRSRPHNDSTEPQERHVRDRTAAQRTRTGNANNAQQFMITGLEAEPERRERKREGKKK